MILNPKPKKAYSVNDLYYLLTQVKIDEQERLIRDLEGTLQRSGVEIDRRLMAQQKEYEQKIQLLMHQLMEAGNQSSSNGNTDLMNGHDPALEQRFVLHGCILTDI